MSLSAEHQPRQIAWQSTISSLHLTKRGKFSLPQSSLFVVYPCLCVCVCIFEQKAVNNPAELWAKTPWSVFALSHSDRDKHVGRLLGRFCLSQHGITPLIWSHFAWLHPGWLPVGAQRGRQLDRRSLLLIGWQDAGSVSHWVDPLSSCYLLSPVPLSLATALLKEDQASPFVSKAVALLAVQ